MLMFPRTFLHTSSCFVDHCLSYHHFELSMSRVESLSFSLICDGCQLIDSFLLLNLPTFLLRLLTSDDWPLVSQSGHQERYGQRIKCACVFTQVYRNLTHPSGSCLVLTNLISGPANRNGHTSTQNVATFKPFGPRSHLPLRWFNWLRLRSVEV